MSDAESFEFLVTPVKKKKIWPGKNYNLYDLFISILLYYFIIQVVIFFIFYFSQIKIDKS